MFGISYLAINQLLTAAAVGPDSPLKAIFPVMAANDFYRDVVTMGGGTAHAYGARLRRGLLAAQRGQPGAGVRQARRS